MPRTARWSTRWPILLALAAGCSSSGSQGGMDMPVACVASATGAVTTTDSCTSYVCRQIGAGFDSFQFSAPTVNGTFSVTGALAVRSYTSADLRSFQVIIDAASGKHYAATKGISGGAAAGSTAALTVASVTEPSGTQCNGVAHGSASATLVEYDPSTGMPTGSGVVNAVINF